MTGSLDYPISASQLKTFKGCPKQYWFHYATDAEGTKLGAGYRSLGSAVHEAIENVLRKDPAERDQVLLETALLAEHDRLDYSYPDEMEADAVGCLRNAAEYVATELADETVFGIEVDRRFQVNRPDLAQAYRAIMDVTTDRGIVDWKTGRRRPGDEKVQAGVYLAAYSAVYERVPEYIRFVYLKKDLEYYEHAQTDGNGHTYWDESVNEYWDDVIDVSKQILRAWETDTWPAFPDESSCYWCDYEGWCDASPVGYGGIPWWKY